LDRARQQIVPALPVVAVTLMLAGCGDLLSLHSLYTAQDRVFDPALEGRWLHEDTILTVERDANFYKLTTQSNKDPAKPDVWEMRLVDVGGVRFADILESEGGVGHMILKVSVAGSELRLAFFDSKWLRDRVPHEEAEVSNGDHLAVLTMSTADLRRLVEKYAPSPRPTTTHSSFAAPERQESADAEPPA
jgi:hypothetical protein